MRLINADALRDAFECLLYNDVDDMKRTQRLIDEAPTVKLNTNEIEYKAYSKGLEDGRKINRPHGEWIPVSERLPKEKINPKTKDFEPVLCSTSFGDVMAYVYGKPLGHDIAHFWNGGGVMDEYVVAWMPLPDPYKEEGEAK